MGRGTAAAVYLVLSIVSSAHLSCANPVDNYAALDEAIKLAVNSGFSWQPEPWEKALQSPPRLYLANIWRPDSAPSQPPQPKIPITLFTALTVGRLPQLMQQCASFNGPVVASVWTPIVLPPGAPAAAEGAQAQSTAAVTPQGTVSTTRTVNINMRLSTTTTVTSQQEQPTQENPAGTRLLHDAGAATFSDIPSAAAVQLADAMEEVERLFAIMRRRRILMAIQEAGGQGYGTANADQTTGEDTPAEGGVEGEEGAEDLGVEEGEEMGGMELNGPGCDLTVLMFAQPVADAVMPTFLFPINSLRNYAGLMARTPLVAMIDVDLVLNAHFVADLVANERRLRHLEALAASGALLVMPAFEALRCEEPNCADGFAEGLAAARGDKELVASMFKNGSLDVFHCNKGLHFSTDYMKWFRSTDVFQIPYVQGAEPWYIGHRSMIPFYDNRFVGFGFNKQLQVMYAAGNLGMRIHVLPDAWLVHLPHNRTVASKTFDNRRQFGNQTARRSGVYARHRLGGFTSGAASIANRLFQMRHSFNSSRLRARAAAIQAGGTLRPLTNSSMPLSQRMAMKSAMLEALRRRSGAPEEGPAAGAAAAAAVGGPATATAAATTAVTGPPVTQAAVGATARRALLQVTEPIVAAAPAQQQARQQEQQQVQQQAAPAQQQMQQVQQAASPTQALPDSATGTSESPNPTTLDASLVASQVRSRLAVISARRRGAMNGAVSGPESLHDRYGRYFHRYMHTMGRPLRYAADAKLPSDYQPQLDEGMKQLLQQLPWWSVYRTAWKTGQPSLSDFPTGFGALKCVSQTSEVQALRAAIKVCSPGLKQATQLVPPPPPQTAAT